MNKQNMSLRFLPNLFHVQCHFYNRNIFSHHLTILLILITFIFVVMLSLYKWTFHYSSHYGDTLYNSYGFHICCGDSTFIITIGQQLITHWQCFLLFCFSGWGGRGSLQHWPDYGVKKCEVGIHIGWRSSRDWWYRPRNRGAGRDVSLMGTVTE